MDEPKYILENGTRIVTHAGITETAAGFTVATKHMSARRGEAKGVVAGIVGGHGGDVYWVKHEDGEVGAYGFWEFELDTTAPEKPAKTAWERL